MPPTWPSDCRATCASCISPGGTAALRRSFELVRPRWWPTFGLAIVAYLLAQIVQSAFAILLVGVINIIWGIAAVGNSKFFIDDATYVLSGLNTWGWIILVIGVAQLFAAYSIWRGGQFGRWFGIAVAGLNAYSDAYRELGGEPN